jgi:PAS domain S-box-containing protein
VASRYYQLALHGGDLHWERFNESLDRWYDIRVFSPLKGQFALVFYDITERKRAQEALAEKETQFRQMTACLADVLYGVDGHTGEFSYLSPAFARIFGYTPEDVHLLGGRDKFLSTVIQDDKFGAQRGLFVAMQQTPSEASTLWVSWWRCKDGKRKFIEDLSIPAYAGGRLQATYGVLRDITERRQMEKRMQQAEKMEAIGTLAGGIAHDFNNMLGAMFGYAYLLQQDTVGNSLAQESVAEILTAANRARDLVRQILTFSRQREQKPQVIKLDTVIQEVIKFLRASLPAHIKIEKELAAETPAVLADSTQIYQVTMNLATNALHAMEDGPGRLQVRLDPVLPAEPLLRAHPELKPILYARLTVADTGQGMDAKTLERIFEPFFTTKPVGKGTGLGLAVVHGIVKAHNGVITVDSQVGQGTTFTLYFPALAQAETSTPTAAGAVPRGHGQKILVVDDETALTSALQKMLRRLDYQVTTCNQAGAAIRLVREHPEQFDLVITDLTMPEMNGVEVARQLRALHPDLAVILVSGYSVSVAAEHLREVGICERLEKPVSPSLLAAAVARALQKS